jgi:hypothetical protein
MDIINVLNFDEDLLRLLYYAPSNLVTNTPDPLDISLQNILDMDEETQWAIRDERIKLTDKTDDLTPDKPICRLFIYPGRRSPSRGNFLFANQEVVIDILCHNDYENSDLRTTRIADRLNELFVSERITGIGTMDYLNGTPINSPKEYVGYRHVYNFGEFKK